MEGNTSEIIIKKLSKLPYTYKGNINYIIKKINKYIEKYLNMKIF